MRSVASSSEDETIKKDYIGHLQQVRGKKKNAVYNRNKCIDGIKFNFGMRFRSILTNSFPKRFALWSVPISGSIKTFNQAIIKSLSSSHFHWTSLSRISSGLMKLSFKSMTSLLLIIENCESGDSSTFVGAWLFPISENGVGGCMGKDTFENFK